MGKGYSPEQIVRKLRPAEGKLATGSTTSEAARELASARLCFIVLGIATVGRVHTGGQAAQGARKRECTPCAMRRTRFRNSYLRTVVQGTLTQKVFETCVEHFLAPALKKGRLW